MFWYTRAWSLSQTNNVTPKYSVLELDLRCHPGDESTTWRCFVALENMLSHFTSLEDLRLSISWPRNFNERLDIPVLHQHRKLSRYSCDREYSLALPESLWEDLSRSPCVLSAHNRIYLQQEAGLECLALSECTTCWVSNVSMW